MYVKASTNNPLGKRPWNATLQPGGLGAFFPNAEAGGFNSVLLDRDAANPGWKSWGAGLNSAPRIYYPPEVRKQYSTPRGQGLGVVTQAASIRTQVWPTFFPARAGGVVGPIITGVYSPAAPTVPNTPQSAPTLVANPTPPVLTPRNYFPFVAPVVATPAPGAPATQPNATPGIVQATTQSGTTVSVATSPVPASQPTGTPYVNNDGSIWVYATSSGQWTQAVPPGASTANTYTDTNGNVWSWTSTGWAISGSSATGVSGISSWLTSSSIISSIPNYWLVGGAVLVGVMMMKGKK
jgi:hypothetical protein